MARSICNLVLAQRLPPIYGAPQCRIPLPLRTATCVKRSTTTTYYHLKAINEADDAENKVREPLLRCRDPVVCQNSADRLSSPPIVVIQNASQPFAAIDK